MLRSNWSLFFLLIAAFATLAQATLLTSADAKNYSTWMLDSIISRGDGLGSSGAATSLIELVCDPSLFLVSSNPCYNRPISYHPPVQSYDPPRPVTLTSKHSRASSNNPYGSPSPPPRIPRKRPRGRIICRVALMVAALHDLRTRRGTWDSR